MADKRLGWMGPCCRELRKLKAESDDVQSSVAFASPTGFSSAIFDELELFCQALFLASLSLGRNWRKIRFLLR